MNAPTASRIDLKALDERAVSALESGDPEALARFEREIGVTPAFAHAEIGAGRSEALLMMSERVGRVSEPNGAFEGGTTVLARGTDGGSILFAVGEVESDDPKSEIVKVKLKQVMKSLSLSSEEFSKQGFIHVSKAGAGEYAFFNRPDVVEISPLHLSRVLSMRASALLDRIAAKGLGSVAPVAPPVPDQAKIDQFVQTAHTVFIQWGFDDALRHHRGYTSRVVGAVYDAAAAAEAKSPGVHCSFSDEFTFPSVTLSGKDLANVQAAAKEVVLVLLSYEGVVSLADRRQKDLGEMSAPDDAFSERMKKALKNAVGVIHPDSQASRMLVENAIAAPVSEVRQRWSAVLTAWPFVRSFDFHEDQAWLKDEFQSIVDAGVPCMSAELAAPEKVQNDSLMQP